MPLGLILLSRGRIVHEQLLSALTKQRKTGLPLGQCLRLVAGISEQDITTAIAEQWACPILPNATGPVSLLERIPLRLQEHHRAVPLHFNRKSGTTLIGFARGIDHRLMIAVEHMLSAHAQPCIVSDSDLEACLERRRASSTNEVTIDTILSPEELASTVGSYAQQLRASQIGFTSCNEYLWVSVRGQRTEMQLLFRNLPATQPAVELSKQRRTKHQALLCR